MPFRPLLLGVLTVISACASGASAEETSKLALRCAAEEFKVPWTSSNEYAKALSYGRALVFLDKVGGDFEIARHRAFNLAEQTRHSPRIVEAEACEAILTPLDRQNAETLVIMNSVE